MVLSAAFKDVPSDPDQRYFMLEMLPDKEGDD